MSEEIRWESFRESPLVKQALTHPSCALQTDDGQPFNNQRLEFLGDSVLGLLVADLLYQLYPEAREGELARRFSALVCGETLVKIALNIGLDNALILSESEEENSGRTNASSLEDACEALIGALYLDGGYEVARQFVYKHWEAPAKELSEPPKDPKTALQEWAQGRGIGLPEYNVVEESGPVHAPEFTVEVSVEGKGEARASAASKKAAERAAAKVLFEKLT